MPTSLLVEEITSQSFIVNWEEPDEGGGAREIKEYNVTWRSNHNSCGSKIVNETNTTVLGLLSNTKYEVFVAASVDDVIVGESGVINVTSCKFS